MAIQVACESCGAAFAVADTHAGKRIKCKSCGELVRVPTDDEPPRSAGPSRKKRKPVRKQSSPLPLIVGGVAIGVVALVGGLVLLLQSRPPAPAAAPNGEPVAAASTPVENAATSATPPATDAVGATAPAFDPHAEKDLAAAMQDARTARAETIPVLRSIRTAGDIPAAKGKLLASSERAFAADRRALELQASGKVDPAALARLKTEDEAERKQASKAFAEAMNAIIKNRELVQEFSSITREMVAQRQNFEKSLPPELAALLTVRTSSPGDEALAKILPQGLSVSEIAGNFRSFAREHGADHCAVIIAVSSTNEVGAACGERIREITANQFVSYTTKPVTVGGAARFATVAYPTSLESQQELIEAIDFGEVTAGDATLGVYVVAARDDYQFRPGVGAVVKNPNYVWEGYRPSSFHLLNEPDVAITLRLDGVDPDQAYAVGPRVVRKILGDTKDRIDARSHKRHSYVVLKGPANFDEFVKQSAAAGQVVQTIPNRRVVILAVNPADFPE